MEAEPPTPGQERRLEAHLRVEDGPRGGLGWRRDGDWVLAKIASVAPDAVIENDGRRVVVYAATNEDLDAVRAAIELVLSSNKIPASFDISEWDSAAAEWRQTASSDTARGAPVLISTMNDVPGYDIEVVLGEVFGLTVRSRNVVAQLGANLKAVVGGELRGMTKVLTSSRDEVTQRLIESARAKGANAVIAFRFDTSAIGDTWTEICAYGTAVKIRKQGPADSQTPAPEGSHSSPPSPAG
jgi:uncharacterized protein YbjQ (UPF0145 family)